MVDSKRKNINVSTFKKIEDFLKEQSEHVYKSDIVKKIGVDFNSLGVALGMLKINVDDEGRVKLE